MIHPKPEWLSGAGREFSLSEVLVSESVMKKGADEILRDALKKAYLARAKLFAQGIQKRSIEETKRFLADQKSTEVAWNLGQLGISKAAFEKVRASGVEPHMVFCHPKIVEANPQVLEYYRNLAALSNKGLNQMLAGVKTQERASERIRLINNVVSAIVEDLPTFDLALARSVIPVEIGAELQGEWVNRIGQGAATYVEDLMTDFAKSKSVVRSIEKKTVRIKGKRKTHRSILLTNGWRIIFGDEPDVSIRDTKNVLKAAIEIKGSMDRAGAQTRYGEAKKSFGKALKEHAQCETIYLASCFTAAVNEQIEADAQVRKTFNLVEIMADPAKRKEFLREIFVYQIRVVT